MAKPEQPLLSMGAHGSLGNAVTFQVRHQKPFVRKKPIPTQANTLAQIYHRWDYQFYAHLWHALSAAEKQQYESDARRRRITGFNLWMSEHLNTLPDLVGRWHLDEAGGIIAHDTSKSGYHGTIFGATPVDGYISGARRFDGIDDRIDCGICPNLNFTDEDFSISFWTNNDYTESGCVCANLAVGPGRGWAMRLHLTPRISLVQYFLGGVRDTHGVPLWTLGWHHYAIIRKQPNQGKVYQDTIDVTTAGATRDCSVSPLSFFIGDNPPIAGQELNADLDELLIFNRALTFTEVKMLYERRYPQ